MGPVNTAMNVYPNENSQNTNNSVYYHSLFPSGPALGRSAPEDMSTKNYPSRQPPIGSRDKKPDHSDCEDKLNVAILDVFDHVNEHMLINNHRYKALEEENDQLHRRIDILSEEVSRLSGICTSLLAMSRSHASSYVDAVPSTPKVRSYEPHSLLISLGSLSFSGSLNNFNVFNNDMLCASGLRVSGNRPTGDIRKHNVDMMSSIALSGQYPVVRDLWTSIDYSDVKSARLGDFVVTNTNFVQHSKIAKKLMGTILLALCTDTVYNALASSRHTVDVNHRYGGDHHSTASNKNICQNGTLVSIPAGPPVSTTFSLNFDRLFSSYSLSFTGTAISTSQDSDRPVGTVTLYNETTGLEMFTLPLKLDALALVTSSLVTYSMSAHTSYLLYLSGTEHKFTVTLTVINPVGSSVPLGLYWNLNLDPAVNSDTVGNLLVKQESTMDTNMVDWNVSDWIHVELPHYPPQPVQVVGGVDIHGIHIDQEIPFWVSETRPSTVSQYEWSQSSLDRNKEMHATNGNTARSFKIAKTAKTCSLKRARKLEVEDHPLVFLEEAALVDEPYIKTDAGVSKPTEPLKPSEVDEICDKPIVADIEDSFLLKPLDPETKAAVVAIQAVEDAKFDDRQWIWIGPDLLIPITPVWTLFEDAWRCKNYAETNAEKYTPNESDKPKPPGEPRGQPKAEAVENVNNWEQMIDRICAQEEEKLINTVRKNNCWRIARKVVAKVEKPDYIALAAAKPCDEVLTLMNMFSWNAELLKLIGSKGQSLARHNATLLQYRHAIFDLVYSYARVNPPPGSIAGFSEYLKESHNRAMHALNGNMDYSLFLQRNHNQTMHSQNGNMNTYPTWPPKDRPTRKFNPVSIMEKVKGVNSVLNPITNPYDWEMAGIQADNTTGLLQFGVSDSLWSAAMGQILNTADTSVLKVNTASMMLDTPVPYGGVYAGISQRLEGFQGVPNGLKDGWMYADYASMPEGLNYTTPSLFSFYLKAHLLALCNAPSVNTETEYRRTCDQFIVAQPDLDNGPILGLAELNGMWCDPLIAGLGRMPYTGTGGTIGFYSSWTAVPPHARHKAISIPWTLYDADQADYPTLVATFLACVASWPSVLTVGYDNAGPNNYFAAPNGMKVFIPGITDLHVVLPSLRSNTPPQQRNDIVVNLPAFGLARPNGTPAININDIGFVGQLPTYFNLGLFFWTWNNQIRSDHVSRLISLLRFKSQSDYNASWELACHLMTTRFSSCTGPNIASDSRTRNYFSMFVAPQMGHMNAAYNGDSCLTIPETPLNFLRASVLDWLPTEKSLQQVDYESALLGNGLVWLGSKTAAAMSLFFHSLHTDKNVLRDASLPPWINILRYMTYREDNPLNGELGGMFLEDIGMKCLEFVYSGARWGSVTYSIWDTISWPISRLPEIVNANDINLGSIDRPCAPPQLTFILRGIELLDAAPPPTAINGWYVGKDKPGRFRTVGVNSTHKMEESTDEFLIIDSSNNENLAEYAYAAYYDNHVYEFRSQSGQLVDPVVNGWESDFVVHERGLPQAIPYYPARWTRVIINGTSYQEPVYMVIPNADVADWYSSASGTAPFYVAAWIPPITTSKEITMKSQYPIGRVTVPSAVKLRSPTTVVADGSTN